METKLKYQHYESPNQWYSLVYPKYWEMEVIEGIPAFFDPEEGAGALIISAFQNLEESYDLNQELINFLFQHNVEFEEENIAKFKNSEGSEIRACEFFSDNRFWLVYMLANNSKLIVCTYNSDESPDKELTSILTTIISSIKIKNYE